MVQVSTVRVVHTADLTTDERVRIRDLLDLAFAGRFDDADWDHALGGLHIIVTEQDRPVAHAAVVQRHLLHDNRPIRTGYVEAVAVAVDRRGRGLAGTVMDEAERVIRAAYHLGALSASRPAQGLYRSRGWLAWQGPTYAVTPTGLRRTPDDDDSTFVLPASANHDLRVTGTLACDWRHGDLW
jgi:aminoglycoside 2'-N-acetyltransferase I